MRSSGISSFPYFLLLVKALFSSGRLFIRLRVWFLASFGEIAFSGSSGLVSRSLLHLIFHTKKAHSESTIQRRCVAQNWDHAFIERNLAEGNEEAEELS